MGWCFRHLFYWWCLGLDTFVIKGHVKGVFRGSDWITEDHSIYNVDKIPQNRAHEGLTRPFWVTLILPTIPVLVS